MTSFIAQLPALQLSPDKTEQLSQWFHVIHDTQLTAEQAWQFLAKNLLAHHYPFNIHLAIYKSLFPAWPQHPDSAPVYVPNNLIIDHANLTKLMHEKKITSLRDFHHWSTKYYQDYWQTMIHKLQIVFTQRPTSICDLSNGITLPNWLPGAELNIIDSCFTAPPDKTALVYQDEQHIIYQLTYAELKHLVNAIAFSLVQQGYKKGDFIAIAMPMNAFAVATYLAIIKIGGIVVSIADSFSPEEMNVRLKITHAKVIFTQDSVLRGGKEYPLYDKVRTTIVSKIIVLPRMLSPKTPSNHSPDTITLRNQDIRWCDFFTTTNDMDSIPCQPMDACNILFSSGTTSEPKAIVWNHTTAIKAASDACLHQNIQPDDILAWPTNLGWMMGPWLIYAALINQATIALYIDNPKEREFGDFIARAKVTMLGVVPTLVAAWRQSQCMIGLDWSSIKLATSTGECSNPEDMFYLMYLIGYQPIIEYCGGTEIGGAYITSTVIENNFPSVFTTPAMGLDIAILDETGHLADEGEVAIIPPSFGLSTQLLNADHAHVYYENMPVLSDGKPLRRHGDQIRRYPSGCYTIEGRVDDTMNLGGIKVSSAEIERALIGIDKISEVAAIAVSPQLGPSQLVIYAATNNTLDKKSTIDIMQQRINQRINPLFRISDIVFISELPKTASNKVMRRMLRKKYLAD